MGGSMRVLFLFFIFCGLVFAFSGCSDPSPDQAPKTSKASCAYAYPSQVNPEIAPTSVIARVNGESIIRADFDAWMSLRDLVYGLHYGLDLSKRQEKIVTYRKATRDMVLLDLIRREVLRQESERRGLAPSSAALQVAQRNFMKGIRRANGRFDEFCETLPNPLKEMLSRLIVSDARDNQLLKAWATNDVFSVSDQEVSNRLEFACQYQRDIEKMNADAKRRAAAAKAEILAGASFYSVTTNRADIFKEQGKEWDTIELGELDEESDLFRFLASANAGDISDPIDFDDGIGIVGVVAKELGEVPEGVVPAMQYTVVRCVFTAYEELDEPQDFEALRKLLRERKLTSAREALVRELAAKAKIELPYGEKLFGYKKKKSADGSKRKKAGVRKKRPKSAK